jgi:hypothetical protein
MGGRFFFTEYLSMLVPHYIAKIFTAAGVKDETFFRLYSCAAGALFVFTACLLAHQAGKGPTLKTLSFLAIVSSSLLLFFCGYVEVYSFPAVLLLLYIYTGFRYLGRSVPFYYPLIVLVFAIGFHLINAAGIPSLLILYYWRNKQRFPHIQKLNNNRIAIITAVLTLAGTLICLFSGNGFIMPVKKSADHFPFLSLQHIWEFTNGQILCSGLNLFICGALLAKVVKQKIILNAELYFLVTLAAFLLLLVLICNLQRGSGDWDIMAFPSIALNLLCVLLCTHVLSHGGKYLAFFLCIFNLINAILWIDINHTEKSLTRVDQMFVNDTAPYFSSIRSRKVQLAVWFKNKRLYGTAKKFALQACNEPGTTDLRGCLLFAECARRMGNTEEAANMYEWLLTEKRQKIFEASLFLLDHYGKKNNSEKVVLYLKDLYASFDADPQFYFMNSHFEAQMMADLIMALYEIEGNESPPERRKHMTDQAQKLREMSATPR